MEHNEAISCMAKNPNHLKGIFAGSEDGGTDSSTLLGISIFVC